MDHSQAASTSIEAVDTSVVRRGTSDHPVRQDSLTSPATDTNKAALKKALGRSKKDAVRKYRHTAALHAASRPSTLSHDATETPSFLGFRNLGLIVLVAGNLRLLIENIQKYGVLICVRCHDFRRQDLQVGFVLYTLVPCCLLVAYLIELFAAYEARTQRLRAFNRRRRGDSITGKDSDAGSGSGSGSSRSDLGRGRDATTITTTTTTDRDAPLSTADGSRSPTEDEAARFRTTWHIIAWLHFVNISSALVVTSWVVYFYVNHPLIGTIVEMHAIIVWLKTASYALTNRDLRHAYLHPHTGELEAIPELYHSCMYPKNVTFGNLCYFWWAPTLIYQPVYPRTDKIRWLFVVKRLGEVVGLCVVMWVLSAQYAAPTLQNSLRAWKEWDLASMVERVLKLSTISLVIWLAGFFALFQSFLNALAEVMKFADRSFYDDCMSGLRITFLVDLCVTPGR